MLTHKISTFARMTRCGENADILSGEFDVEERIMPDSIVSSDGWRGYDVMDVSQFKHYRINSTIKTVKTMD